MTSPSHTVKQNGLTLAPPKNMHLGWLFKSILIVVIAASSNSWAGTLQCSGIFSSQATGFEAISRDPIFQKLASAMPQFPLPIVKRYWKDPMTVAIAEQLLARTDGISHSFKIPDKGSFVIRTLQMEDHLFMDLVHVQIIDNGQYLKVGQQASGNNTLFAKTLVAYLQAAYETAAKDPSLSTVIFGAVNLKNPMLIELLKENGFVAKSVHTYSKDFEKVVELR